MWVPFSACRLREEPTPVDYLHRGPDATLAEVLRVDLPDLMRYAGYLPGVETPGAQSKDPFHQLMGQIESLTNDQLIVLIDQAWEAYRNRHGFSLEDPGRRGKKADR